MRAAAVVPNLKLGPRHIPTSDLNIRNVAFGCPTITQGTEFLKNQSHGTKAKYKGTHTAL